MLNPFVMYFYIGMYGIVDWVEKWRLGDLVSSGFVAWDIITGYVRALSIFMALGPALLFYVGNSDPAEYHVNLDIRADSPQEVRMLERAESAYPPREVVVACIESSGAAGALPDGDLWWCDSWEGMLLPYAITGDAIAYYQQLIETREARGGADGSDTTFGYEAIVRFLGLWDLPDRGPTEIYEVSMELEWRYSGRAKRVYFYKDRVVLLTGDGEILEVYGDGPTQVERVVY
jgi:hypothetical protein